VDVYHVIQLRHERVDGLRRAYWSGKHNAVRSLLSDRPHGGERGDTGCEAIVDKDHGPALEVDRWAIASIQTHSSLHLDGLPTGNVLDVLGRHTWYARRLGTHDEDAARRNCPDAKLRLSGSTEFARDQYVERRRERPRNLVADRNPAARQGKHDRVRVLVSFQPLGKLPSGVMSVQKPHSPLLSPLYRTTLSNGHATMPDHKVATLLRSVTRVLQYPHERQQSCALNVHNHRRPSVVSRPERVFGSVHGRLHVRSARLPAESRIPPNFEPERRPRTEAEKRARATGVDEHRKHGGAAVRAEQKERAEETATGCNSHDRPPAPSRWDVIQTKQRR